MRRVRRFNGAMLGLVAALLCLAAQPAFSDSAASKADIQAGKELAFGRTDGNCLACHQIEGGKLMGNVGPALVDMKARYPDREVLFKRIWDETQFNPMTVMPPFGRNGILTKQEINRIIDFLYTL